MSLPKEDAQFYDLLKAANARQVEGGGWRCDCVTKNIRPATKTDCPKCDVYNPLQALAVFIYLEAQSSTDVDDLPWRSDVGGALAKLVSVRGANANDLAERFRIEARILQRAADIARMLAG